MKRGRMLVGGALSLLLVVFMVRGVDPAGLAAAFLNAELYLVVPALGLYLVGLGFRTLRWKFLLRSFGDVPAAQLFRILIIGLAVNNVMPARLGELARVILVSRSSSVSPGATLASIAVERVMDGITLCLFLVLSLAFVPLSSWLRNLALFGLAAFIIGAAVLVQFGLFPAFWERVAMSVVQLMPGRLQLRTIGLVGGFVRGMTLLRDPTTLLLVSATSVTAWTFEAAMYFVIMLGFPIDAGPAAALIGMAAANLGTLVPSSPGYVGTFDLPLQATLTGLFGASAEVATSYTLAVHVSLLLPVIVLGLFFLWKQELSMREVAAIGRPGHPMTAEGVGGGRRWRG